MDGDKEVGLVLVGNLCPAVELHETVGLTGVDDLHVGAVLFHELAEGQGELQRQVLLYRDSAFGPWIAAPVTGIDHERKRLVLGLDRQSQAEQANSYYIS